MKIRSRIKSRIQSAAHSRTCNSAVLLCLCFLVGSGCSNGSGPPPGVTYSLAIIIKGKDGKVEQLEPAEVIENAQPEDLRELDCQDGRLLVHVRKTQYGKATFEVTFPTNTSQMAQIKAGETKDLVPRKAKTGVRIAVQESR
jgi:hypothetical protein